MNMALNPSSVTVRRASATAASTSCGASMAAPSSRVGFSAQKWASHSLYAREVAAHLGEPDGRPGLEPGVDVVEPEIGGLENVHVGVGDPESLLRHRVPSHSVRTVTRPFALPEPRCYHSGDSMGIGRATGVG